VDALEEEKKFFSFKPHICLKKKARAKAVGDIRARLRHLARFSL
jgi:hypothetical protein